jgi:hypothetical protein
MTATTVLATLAIDRYAESWRQLCRPSWRRYADRHGYALVAFDRPLDASARAQARSPAWQKLLILEQPEIRDFARVVWIDADVVINARQAPPIDADVPSEKIGITDEMALFDIDLAAPRRRLYEAVIARSNRAQGIEDSRDPYAAFALTPAFPRLLNTGVMVLSPRHHATLLRHVYDAYEDKGAPGYNYEMRPLSHEILRRGLDHAINRRFNLLWPHYAHVFHPAIDRRYPVMSGLVYAVATAFVNGFFLHFAGSQSDMRFLQYVAANSAGFYIRPDLREDYLTRLREEVEAFGARFLNKAKIDRHG